MKNNNADNIRVVMVTFTCNHTARSNKGVYRYFLFREQVMAEGKLNILVDPITMTTVEAYRYVEGDEWWILPTDVVVEDDNVIPDDKRSIAKWWRDKYQMQWSGDIRGLILDTIGVDIHGKVEHNGIELWKKLQKENKSNVKVAGKVKFNASEDITFNKIEVKGEDIYYLK